LGPIDHKKEIYFRFGDPINIKGTGKEENREIIEFIKASLKEWEISEK
jgi:1-acyl-sn-glycerol-3-phosphate acyltransferase